MTPIAKRARVLAGLLVAGIMLTLAACGGSPPPYVYRYVLNYPAPAPAPGPPIEAALKVERLGSLPLINNQKMLQVIGQREIAAMPEHKWQNYPADMVSSLLTRDLRSSGRLAAVFGPDSSQLPRFRLDGGVVQFVEQEEKGGAKAEIRLDLTLLDYRYHQVLKQVMFQKSYAASAPVKGKGGEALAAAMSRAMAEVSPKVCADVAQAVAARKALPDPDEAQKSK